MNLLDFFNFDYFIGAAFGIGIVEAGIRIYRLKINETESEKKINSLTENNLKKIDEIVENFDKKIDEIVKKIDSKFDYKFNFFEQKIDKIALRTDKVIALQNEVNDLTGMIIGLNRKLKSARNREHKAQDKE